MSSGFIKTKKGCKCGCGCSGLSDSKGCGCTGLGNVSMTVQEQIEEQQKAEKTSEDAIKAAERFSNPDIPLPLKLTGIAIIIFIITR